MNERLNVAILDPDACLSQLDKAKGPVELTLVPSASAEDLLSSVAIDEPDIILLDFEMPGISGLELTKRLRAANPGVPILLLSANPDWSILEGDPFIEIVRSPIDPREVIQRISRLLHSLSLEETSGNFRLPNWVVDELRAESGRIDAKKVAELFDLSIPVLAKTIDVGEPALYKTPDARSVQTKLIDFERIAWGLLKLTGSIRGMRIWLNAPNVELDNELPIDYIKDGHVEDIAAMVEDALLGHPS